jgi:hypothetical protein
MRLPGGRTIGTRHILVMIDARHCAISWEHGGGYTILSELAVRVRAGVATLEHTDSVGQPGLELETWSASRESKVTPLYCSCCCVGKA